MENIEAETEVLSDPFFHRINIAEWNCFVGSQSDDDCYADGYIEASLTLVNFIIEKREYGKRDTLIFPILFNARHAIELRLKLIIKNLVAYGLLKKGHEVNHDIQSHWRFLDDANIGDSCFRELVSQLEPYVISLSCIDEDGQQFRYPQTRDGKQSLDKHSLINLLVVQHSLSALSKILEEIKYRTHELCQEKMTGIFTDACSRSDLLEIARTLPPHGEWKGKEFLRAKSEAMTRFGLSGRQFCKAVNKILESRGMKALLGIETALLHVSDQKASLVVAEGRRLQEEFKRADSRREKHPKRSGTLVVYTASPLPDEYYVAETEICERLASQLTDDEWVDVEVIYDMANHGFPESYGWRVEHAKNEPMTDRTPERIAHFLRKGRFVDDFLSGLSRLGRPSLANQLASS